MTAKERKTEVWITVGRGVRYREHPTRKQGQELDRYWCIRYKLNGQSVNEAGRGSDQPHAYPKNPSGQPFASNWGRMDERRGMFRLPEILG